MIHSSEFSNASNIIAEPYFCDRILNAVHVKFSSWPSCTNLSLEIYSLNSCPGIQEKPHIHTNPNADDYLSSLAKQVEICIQSHVDCRANASAPLPLRVIDVSNEQLIFLHEAQGESGSYTTLSYCWGNAPFFHTTKKTLQNIKKGIVWTSLPRLFKDAIRVTRALGIRYLWIDSLCIIQDSKSHWEIQSGSMANIYAGSYITIAASGSNNLEEGLCHHRHFPTKICSISVNGSQKLFSLGEGLSTSESPETTSMIFRS